MSKIKIGDYVKLTKEAVKNFYSREGREDDYSSYGSVENMTSEEFVKFVDGHCGFESGEGVGLVIGTGANDDTVKVLYQKLTDGYDYHFYAKSDLRKVRL